MVRFTFLLVCILLVQECARCGLCAGQVFLPFMSGAKSVNETQKGGLSEFQNV